MPKIEETRQKSTILRNLIMLERVRSYHAPMTTSEIYQALLDEGYKVSKRTVERDLQKLCEWAELDYEETPNGNLWYRDSRKSDVINIVSTAEAFLLVLSENLLRKILPNSLSAKLEKLLGKASATLASKHQLTRWNRKVSVISDGYPLIPDESQLSEALREIIYKAVLDEEKIKIVYQGAKSESCTDYSLNPIGLIIRDQSHYLAATKVDSPEKPQLFLFHRIKHAERLYLDIVKPKTFSFESYLSTNPTGWVLAEEPEKMVMKVKRFALDVLTHNKLAEDQRLEKLDDEWFRVTFTCIPTYDLIAWVLRYGEDVVLESPQSLRTKVADIVTNSAKNYA
ncbi:WYL domain-containing protein [Vibrio sp. JC009]|uniref:helix-turn-helix transcriptional regulator n=1 Tax=Vibrio sp. JC009 TaxID=2912314 RepID=UPI0023B0B342|nr:WYL domain-containing protein [Vibrio sp. JC009]WED22815.1 WYL domain-containing protein [Vibrio sp. JC009]